MPLFNPPQSQQQNSPRTIASGTTYIINAGSQMLVKSGIRLNGCLTIRGALIGVK